MAQGDITNTQVWSDIRVDELGRVFGKRVDIIWEEQEDGSKVETVRGNIFRDTILPFVSTRDSDDNWLVHAYGTVRWTVNNSLANIPDDTTEFDLTVGDLLYIPTGLEHKAVAQSRRISISVPLMERFGSKPVNRNYYDFSNS